MECKSDVQPPSMPQLVNHQAVCLLRFRSMSVVRINLKYQLPVAICDRAEVLEL